MVINADWNFVTVFWDFGFGLFRGDFKKTNVQLSDYRYHLPLYIRSAGLRNRSFLYQLGIVLAIPVLALYHGRKGRGNTLLKWGFYLFYPGHLLLLELLKIMLR